MGNISRQVARAGQIQVSRITDSDGDRSLDRGTALGGLNGVVGRLNRPIVVVHGRSASKLGVALPHSIFEHAVNVALQPPFYLCVRSYCKWFW